MSTFAPDLLKGRAALVTGGATGIGFAIAATLERLGARVMIASRKEENLKAASARLNGAVHQVMDVRDPDQVEACVAACVDRRGGLDILVANAAGNFVCPTAGLSPNGWRAVIDIDLNGTFFCCRAAYSEMCKSTYGGRIVAISTTRANSGWPGAAHAAAAKAGIQALIRSLAVEWAPDGIRANFVSPGPIAGTVGVEKLYEQEGRAESERRQVALGRFGEAQEIADMVAYLCSPAADYVTGAEMVVDGGRQWTFQGR